MKLNRPLSPHLTIYKPQLTSTLSILHRLSGAFLASMVLLSVLCLKTCELSFSLYPFYWCAFYLVTSYNWFIFSLVNCSILALVYHTSNGIRHLLWDFGLGLDLPKVYTSGIIVIVSTIVLTLFNVVHFMA